MWQSGHTMTVLIAMSMMWMGVVYHYYPVMTGRALNDKLGYWFVWLFSIGTIGAALVMLAGGADGMPRRHADWAQGNWMIYGDFILLFGIFMAVALVLYFVNMMKSRQIEAVAESLAPTE